MPDEAGTMLAQTNTEAGNATDTAQTLMSGTSASEGDAADNSDADASATPGAVKPAGDAGDASDAAKPEDGDKAADDKDGGGDGAPEKYEFSIPEGMTLDQDMVDAFTPLAKELDLTQENAQKLVTMQTERMQAMVEKQQADFVAMQQGWRAEFKAQPGYEKDIALAKKALASDLATDDFRQLISENGSWLGDNPPMLRFLAKVGGLIAEDKIVDGTTRGGGKTAAEIMFPSMK